MFPFFCSCPRFFLKQWNNHHCRCPATGGGSGQCKHASCYQDKELIFCHAKSHKCKSHHTFVKIYHSKWFYNSDQWSWEVVTECAISQVFQFFMLNRKDLPQSVMNKWLWNGTSLLCLSTQKLVLHSPLKSWGFFKTYLAYLFRTVLCSPNSVKSIESILSKDM